MPERSNNAAETLARGRRVLEIERRALQRASDRLGEDFVRAVDIILASKGRTVVTGMGKSGQICRKIAATMASTGTSAFFLHAAEGSHGDLGMFARGDACIAISYSGTTAELVSLLPSIKRLGIPLIAITGGMDSPLAEAGDAVLDVSVNEEACPMGLAPTASTTATLGVGDALAVAVLEAKGFTERDFALLHPGGALGQKLLRVGEVTHKGGEVPLITADIPMNQALTAMSAGGLGATGIVDGDGCLIGVLTDGDIRRAIESRGNFDGMKAGDIMTSDPKTVSADSLAAAALELMERHAITSLFTIDPANGRPTGIVHLHDLLRAGVA